MPPHIIRQDHWIYISNCWCVYMMATSIISFRFWYIPNIKWYLVILPVRTRVCVLYIWKSHTAVNDVQAEKRLPGNRSDPLPYLLWFAKFRLGQVPIWQGDQFPILSNPCTDGSHKWPNTRKSRNCHHSHHWNCKSSNFSLQRTLVPKGFLYTWICIPASKRLVTRESTPTVVIPFISGLLPWSLPTYTGWWFQPLLKIWVSWGYYSQYMEKNMFQTTNQYTYR